MTPERWDQLMDTFEAAADQGLDERSAFLDQACGSDPRLRAEVEELLNNHALAETEDFLTEPPWVIDELPVLLPDFDDFREIEYLGRGGMGVVYRAFDQSLDCAVALKMSLPRRLLTIQDIDRFRVDPQSMARLKQPNIVQVHKVGEWDGKPYFTMNLIERKDGSVGLDKHLARLRNDPAAAAKIMVKVARAVHHAHERGILHRDLKPANILLDDQDNPHITDFGLAKRIGGVETDDARTASGAAHRGVVGTALYMSPEQADPNPDREVTTLSDVYSLGAMLYALLSGQPPFQADSLPEIMNQVRDPELKPKPLRTANPLVDSTLEAICFKCLNKDPNYRYRSAEGLARNLERWLDHEPAIDPPRPFWVRCRNWCRRNPGVTVLIFAVALLLVLSAVMTNMAVVWLRDGLKESALRANILAAERIADHFRLLIRDESRLVVEASHDRDVRDLLQRARGFQTKQDVKEFLRTDDGIALHQKLETLLKNFNSELLADDIPPFATLFFVNVHGQLVDHVAAEEGNDDIDGDYFENRDYFAAARNNASRPGLEAVHISRVFYSRFDELYKFAISVPVVDGDGAFLGAIEASIPMDDTLGLRKGALYSETQKVALIGRVDRSPPTRKGTNASQYKELDYDYHVLLHEAFGDDYLPELRKAKIECPGEWPEPVPEQPELGRTLETRLEPSDHYRDPLAAHLKKYEGDWIAGFARVGNTELIVIVQQRYEDAIGSPAARGRTFLVWGWRTLALAVVLFGTVLWLRRQRLPLV